MTKAIKKPRYLKKHICAFNDGECTCTCFMEGAESVAQECYNACLAVGCGETEYSEAIATQFPNLITKYEQKQ